MNPNIKMLLGLKKEWLVIKAKECGVVPIGTKLELAAKISEKEMERSSRYWDSISNGRT